MRDNKDQYRLSSYYYYKKKWVVVAILGWFARYCSARATLIKKPLRHDLHLGVPEVGTKRFHEGSGIWRPNLGQGCHYWRQGLVGEIGTKRQIALLFKAPPKWSIEIIFGSDGWTKN
jgi:hypothetical protein